MTQGLRLADLINRLGMKKSKIYKLINEGKLPPPRKVGSASIWIESELDEAFIKLLAPPQRVGR